MADEANRGGEESGAYKAYSYSGAFQIRKVMYRVQDVDLPFRRGLRVEQFLVFLLVVFISFVAYQLLISPVLSLIGIPENFMLAALIVLGPATMASVRVGQPMPHNKTIPGTIMSFLSYHLDDEWHRRGMPVPRSVTPDLNEVEGNYLRTWAVDPMYENEATGALAHTRYVNPTFRSFPDHTIKPLDYVQKEKWTPLESEEKFSERLRGNMGVAVEKKKHKRVAPVYIPESKDTNKPQKISEMLNL